MLFRAFLFPIRRKLNGDFDREINIWSCFGVSLSISLHTLVINPLNFSRFQVILLKIVSLFFISIFWVLNLIRRSVILCFYAANFVLYGYKMLAVLIDIIFKLRVRSNGVIRSLKVRNFSSSIPVRYIPKNSPKPRIPLVSTPPKNDIEEQVKHKHTCLDSNVGRAESSYGTEVAKRKFSPKKSFKTENSRSLVPPVNDFHDVSRHGSPESDVLGLELGDGGKSMGGSFDVDEVLDRNHRAIVNLDFNAESGWIPSYQLNF